MTIRKIRWAVYAIVVLASCISVMAQNASSPKVHSEMLVSSEWLAQHTNDPEVIVLHIGRYRAEYDRAHIPGARFVASYDFVSDMQEIPNELPSVQQVKNALEQVGVGDKGRIILYAPGQPTTATRVYFTLDYLGLGDRVALLDGGMEKWKSEKRVVSTETAKFAHGKLTVHPRPEVVAKYDQVRKIADSPESTTTLVDARPASRYKDGHLPGAAPVFWVDNITARDMPVWKSADELRAKFTAAGVKPGDKVITYCETGMQASHDYFTAKYLGYDVALYDGSFDEWTSAKDAPVVKGEARR